jgi:hypothetical protein
MLNRSPLRPLQRSARASGCPQNPASTLSDTVRTRCLPCCCNRRGQARSGGLAHLLHLSRTTSTSAPGWAFRDLCSWGLTVLASGQKGGLPEPLGFPSRAQCWQRRGGSADRPSRIFTPTSSHHTFSPISSCLRPAPPLRQPNALLLGGLRAPRFEKKQKYPRVRRAPPRRDVVSVPVVVVVFLVSSSASWGLSGGLMAVLSTLGPSGVFGVCLGGFAGPSWVS